MLCMALLLPKYCHHQNPGSPRRRRRRGRIYRQTHILVSFRQWLKATLWWPLIPALSTTMTSVPIRVPDMSPMEKRNQRVAINRAFALAEFEKRSSCCEDCGFRGEFSQFLFKHRRPLSDDPGWSDLNGLQRRMRIPAYLITSAYSVERLERELALCVLVCRICYSKRCRSDQFRAHARRRLAAIPAATPPTDDDTTPSPTPPASATKQIEIDEFEPINVPL